MKPFQNITVIRKIDGPLHGKNLFDTKLEQIGKWLIGVLKKVFVERITINFKSIVSFPKAETWDE